MKVDIWNVIREEAEKIIKNEPILKSFLSMTILEFDNIFDAVINLLSEKLENRFLSHSEIHVIFRDAIYDSKTIQNCIVEDLRAIHDRDPASKDLLTPLLNFKGYHALQSHRVAHWLWNRERFELAQLLQSQISLKFGVDIHPAARVGCRVLFDHATSIVVGETAVIGDDVSMLHEVTLGGTGKECGDRHPKVGNGVLIGAGSKVLGNVKIGDGVKIGAGSVVLADVPEHTTVVGIPAKVVGRPCCDKPSLEMNQMIEGGKSY